MARAARWARAMSFRQAYEATLLTIVTTRDLLSVAVLSVVLYAFYYPAPYSHQAAQALPIVVIDGDRGVLARRLIEHLGDTRAIQLVGEVPGMAAARAAVRERRAEGILLLSNDFAREAAAGRAGAGVGIWLNGSYLLRAESIASALAETIEDALAERQAALGTARGRSRRSSSTRCSTRPAATATISFPRSPTSSCNRPCCSPARGWWRSGGGAGCARRGWPRAWADGPPAPRSGCWPRASISVSSSGCRTFRAPGTCPRSRSRCRCSRGRSRHWGWRLGASFATATTR
ncbi:MAG TPA: hypothetical protein DEP91_08315 [Sphingomonas bacterium]|uniref:ABC-2 type transporter transmembrane domain-containing protein n=1 Tax=Sphingomonas bacterium TaxID=1895847 RepID=A0A3D0WBS0_9SPHN|nr:hypothetical protein [Sphingomonas bacterium]